MKNIFTSLVVGTALVASTGLSLADHHEKDDKLKSKYAVTHLVKSDDVVGATLWNFTGDNIGSVKQLLLEPGGQALFAVVNTDILDDDKEILIPWSKIHVRTKEGDSDDIIYTLDTTKEMLRGAPAYSGDEDLKNESLCESVCTYWKVDDAHKMQKKDTTTRETRETTITAPKSQ